MTEDLEARLHGAYATLDPGPAPVELDARIRSAAADAPVLRRWWPRRTRSAQVAAAIVVVVLAAGGGLLLTSEVRPSSSATLATTSPRATPAASPSATGTNLPAGARTVDAGWDLSGLAWSPDGRYLAVDRAEQNGQLEFVDVLDATGQLIDTFDASTAGWIDATHLATFKALQDGSGGGTVAVHAVGGTSDVTIAGTWAGVLPDGHGSLLLIVVPRDAQAWPDQFRIWAAGSLGPVIAGHGTPMAWSPDGRYLALESNFEDGGGGTGGPSSADVEILEFPGATPVRVPGDRRVDSHSPLLFSPDSRSLVATTAVDASRGVYSPTLYDIGGDVTRAIPAPGYGLSWAPGGRLVVQAEDGTLRLWSPTDGSVETGPTGLLTYGPTVDDIVTAGALIDGSPTTIEVATKWGAATLAATGMVPLATWAPDGLAVFVGTGDTGAIGGVEPLIWLPAPGAP